MNDSELRLLAITLLDDEHGINLAAWEILSNHLLESGRHSDILKAVKAVDGRYYLPERAAEILRD